MFICEKCDFSTDNKNKYERHINTQKHLNKYKGYIKTDNNVLICNSCNKQFKSIKTINQHMKLYCNKNNIIKEDVDLLKTNNNEYTYDYLYS